MKKPLLSSLFVLVSVAATTVCAQEKKYPEPEKMTPGMTEFWTPQPKVIAPGKPDKTGSTTAPSDAIVLFDGKDLSKWEDSKGGPAEWIVENDCFTVKPRTGMISTKQKFGSFQLHIEWREPEGIQGSSQGRGNSGIFLQGKYEIQILDNYQNETYVNGQAGSIYKQTPPLVNAMRKPGEWNVYDIIYTAPTFKEDGSYLTPPRVTLLHNGVLVQNNTTIIGTTEYIGVPKVAPHAEGPLQLQDHGNPVSFRNVWVRELK